MTLCLDFAPSSHFLCVQDSWRGCRLLTEPRDSNTPAGGFQHGTDGAELCSAPLQALRCNENFPLVLLLFCPSEALLDPRNISS